VPGKIEEDIALKRHFKSIVYYIYIKQIVENTVGEEFQPIKKEANIVKDIIIKKKKIIM